jgi:lipoprotein-releasing system ATP-binding protein
MTDPRDPRPEGSGVSSGGAAERPTILSARGLEKAYRMGPHRVDVLRGVDVDVREGEILAILGASGSGKSTLLHVLGLLDHADAGTIVFEGRDRASLSAAERAAIRSRAIGFVFQFYHLLPELSALENVALPAMIASGSTSRSAEVARSRHLLEIVGLSHREKHRPSQLSGGERQRVAIARALQNRPRLLLCDEPTGNLDGRTALDVRQLLWRVNAEEGQTLVIVTHDAAVAREAHRVVHLVDGRVVGREGADPAVVAAALGTPAAPTVG